MFDKIEEALEELKKGKMIIVTDNEDRENEGDLLMPIENATPENINFMATHGRGLICAPLSDYYIDKLKLTQMKDDNQDKFKTAFTISIDHKDTDTGISAFERSKTLLSLIDEKTVPSDLNRPGHIFPLHAKKGGVLVREGHTEAAVDFSRLAGFKEAGVICEIMKDDGNMARLPDLLEFAEMHQLKIGTIADLIQYRSQTESIVVREAEREFITPWGRFQGIVYRDKPSNCLHLALVKGQPQPHEEVLVRVHEPVTILDFLDTESSTHSWPLHKALEAIAQSRSGVAVLLNAAGIAAPSELKWLTQFEKLCQQTQGLNNQMSSTSSKSSIERKTDFRSYGIGAQILKDLKVQKMRLLANSARVPSLSGYKLEIIGNVPYSTNRS